MNEFIDFLNSIDLRVLYLITALIAMWGCYQLGFARLCLVYTCAIILFIAVGDALLELPTARLFAGDNELGVAAFVCLIIGFKGVAVLAGLDPASWLVARFRDVVFITSSVFASMIGLYAITGDADHSKHNNRAQISALISEKKIQEDAVLRWQKINHIQRAESSRSEITRINAELAKLRANDDITFIDALEKPATLLRISPDILAAIFNFFRSLLAMYGLLLATKLARKQYYQIKGKPCPSGTNRDGLGTKRGRVFNFGKQNQKELTNEDILGLMAKNKVCKKTASRVDVNDVIRGVRRQGINNSRASKIAQMYKQG